MKQQRSACNRTHAPRPPPSAASCHLRSAQRVHRSPYIPDARPQLSVPAARSQSLPARDHAFHTPCKRRDRISRRRGRCRFRPGRLRRPRSLLQVDRSLVRANRPVGRLRPNAPAEHRPPQIAGVDQPAARNPHRRRQPLARRRLPISRLRSGGTPRASLCRSRRIASRAHQHRMHRHGLRPSRRSLAPRRQPPLLPCKLDHRGLHLRSALPQPHRPAVERRNARRMDQLRPLGKNVRRLTRRALLRSAPRAVPRNPAACAELSCR